MSARRASRAADAATAALFTADEGATERPLSGPAVVAGIDEAGLGPLLGPLVLGCVALRVPDASIDPWSALADVVSSEITDDEERFVVADSKVVFTRNPRGARRLERTVLGFAAARDGARALPATARELLRALEREAGLLERDSTGAESPERASHEASTLEREFFAAELDHALPRQAERGALALDTGRLVDALRRERMEVVALRTRALAPRELNASFAETDNKSRTHWLATRAELAHLWARHGARTDAHGRPAPALDVVVDRQGGRMHYRAALEEAFPRARVVLVTESAPLSRYVVEEPATARSPARAMRLVFREKAERASFAVALASCAAKLVRELAMDAFNAHFARLEPKLVPTAGYVEDGRRWLADARDAIARSGIDRADLVRDR